MFATANVIVTLPFMLTFRTIFMHQNIQKS